MPYRLSLNTNSWLKVLLLGIFLAIQPFLAELYKVLSADTPAWPTQFQWIAFIVLAVFQFVTYIGNFLQSNLRLALNTNSWLKVLLLGIILAIEPFLAELYKVLSADTPAWPTQFQWYAFIVLAVFQFVTYIVNFLQKD